MDSSWSHLVSDEANGPQGRAPLFELVHPVGEGGLGHQDHVRPVDVLEVLHEAEQRDRLQGLTETHLVGLREELFVFNGRSVLLRPEFTIGWNAKTQEPSRPGLRQLRGWRVQTQK